VRTVLFTNTAASIAQLTWTVPNDVIVHWVQTNLTNVVLSNDPSITVALYLAPTESVVGKDVLVFSNFNQELNLPIQGGSKIFVNFTAAKGSIILFIEDVIS